MAKISEVLPIYEKLKNEWNRKPPNVQKTSELIGLLKVYFKFYLFKISFLIFVLRINLLKEDFILQIQMKIHVVYILHV